MNSIKRKAIKSGLIAGSIYALLMAGFDYSETASVQLNRLVFHFLFFGIAMGFVNYYHFKKQQKKSSDKEDFD